MPLTFFAHQAPFIPLLARARGRRWVDGLAFVIGTMTPDLPYIARGSRWSVWAHEGWALVWCNVPVGLVVSWLTARLIAPVVADHLPQLGPLHLPDFRGLAAHRFTIASPLWVLIGALTHIGLDHFTHDWGWVAQHWGWYAEVFMTDPVLDRQWSPYRIAQYVGHVGGLLGCLAFLAHYGRHRWFSDASRRVPPYPVSARSHFILWGVTVVVTGVALAWVLGERRGSAVDIMRVTGGCYLGLLLASVHLGATRPNHPRSRY